MKSKKKVLITGALIALGVVASLILAFAYIDKKKYEQALVYEEIERAANAHSKAVEALSECQRLHDENQRLYNANHRLSNPYSNPGERADDYERRVKIQCNYKLNDYWLQCAEEKYQEGFECYTKEEWEKSILKSNAVGPSRDNLQKLNMQIKNY